MLRPYLTVGLLALLLASCSSQTQQSSPRDDSANRAEVAADRAFVVLESGEVVSLPGTAPSEAEAAMLSAESGLAESIAIPQPSYTARAGWFIVDTALVFPATVTPSKARQTTLQVARAAGLEMALPPEISMTSLLSDMMDETAGSAFERTTWSTFALSTISGHLVDENILTDRLEPLSGGAFRYRMVLEARVEAVIGERNPALSLEIDVNERLLSDGDELIIRAKPSMDGYLYIFNFLSDQSVTLLFPNKFMSDAKVEGGRWAESPTQAERNRGIRFRVAADPSMPTTTETIFCLFSRQPIADLASLTTVNADYITFSAGDESFTRFQRWLSEIPLSQRVERAVQLHIVSKKR